VTLVRSATLRTSRAMSTIQELKLLLLCTVQIIPRSTEHTPELPQAVLLRSSRDHTRRGPACRPSVQRCQVVWYLGVRSTRALFG
jgi:hypothetical protein